MSRRTYSDEQLRLAVAGARSIADVLRALGLFPGGGNYESIKDHIRRLGIEVSHLWTYDSRRRLGSYSDEEIAEAARSSRSFAQLMRKLGISPGGNQARLKERVQRAGIDTSHMLGAGWRRGAHTPVVPARPLGELLVVGKLVKTSTLRDRLIREGLREPVCEICDRRTWNRRPIPLELDHVNGRRDDNQLENLRLLCPNCHAQTDTYRGRNIGISASAYSLGARVAELG
jgi:hypothetical protein